MKVATALTAVLAAAVTMPAFAQVTCPQYPYQLF